MLEIKARQLINLLKMNREQKDKNSHVSQHSSNEMLPAVWLNVKERLPETPFGKEFNYSDFKAVKCKKELYPTTARFEKGEGWQQWYCPLTNDTVEVEFWIDLPHLPKSGNSR